MTSQLRSATVPICTTCWDQQNPGREPVRLRDPDEERCHSCGRQTKSGIYVRAEKDQGVSHAT